MEVTESIAAQKFLSGSLFVQAGTTEVDSTPTMPLPGSASVNRSFKAVKATKRKLSHSDRGIVARKRSRGSGERKPWKNDPNADGALVLNSERGKAGTENYVVVDPFIARKLRPHQAEGVRFLYRCVMGFRNPVYCGAILGDEMGLGKVGLPINQSIEPFPQTPDHSLSPSL